MSILPRRRPDIASIPFLWYSNLEHHESFASLSDLILPDFNVCLRAGDFIANDKRHTRNGY